ncbi:hypothetical protein [Sodalis-like endosymbiont of Proechinophthirus fluctus]
MLALGTLLGTAFGIGAMILLPEYGLQGMVYLCHLRHRRASIRLGAGACP